LASSGFRAARHLSSLAQHTAHDVARDAALSCTLGSGGAGWANGAAALRRQRGTVAVSARRPGRRGEAALMPACSRGSLPEVPCGSGITFCCCTNCLGSPSLGREEPSCGNDHRAHGEQLQCLCRQVCRVLANQQCRLSLHSAEDKHVSAGHELKQCVSRRSSSWSIPVSRSRYRRQSPTAQPSAAPSRRRWRALTAAWARNSEAAPGNCSSDSGWRCGCPSAHLAALLGGRYSTHACLRMGSQVQSLHQCRS